MSRFIDMTGKKYNRLTALEFVERKENRSVWRFRCDCGNETVADGANVRRGTTKSCGCWKNEVIKRQRKFNKYETVDDYVKVEIKDGTYMLCDINDWEKLKNHYWFLSGSGYASAETVKDGAFLFHKVITDTKSEIVDHINQNKLDNRRKNLRIVDMSVNSINRGLQPNNTTGYKGVYFNKKDRKWFARVHVKGEVIHLGYFKTKEEAIKARIEGEEKYYKPQLEKAVQIC